MRTESSTVYAGSVCVWAVSAYVCVCVQRGTFKMSPWPQRATAAIAAAATAAKAASECVHGPQVTYEPLSPSTLSSLFLFPSPHLPCRAQQRVR